MNAEYPTRCHTCIWWKTLDDADKAFFNSKINEVSRLFRASRLAGLNASISAFRQHIWYHHDQGGEQ